MGSRSRSSTENISNVTNNTSTTAFNVSDRATAISGDGNTIINNTMDAGVATDAIFAAGELGLGAFDFAGRVSSDALFSAESMAAGGFGLSRDVTESGFNFGRDLFGDAANMFSDALGMSERTASDAMNVVAGMGRDSLEFADRQNLLMYEANRDATELLGGIAEMQERGLDNALSVARSLGTNDGAEVAENVIKYIAIAAAVAAVAYGLRGKR